MNPYLAVDLLIHCTYTACICPVVSDGMMQFLSSSKLCDLLVTRSLVDVEPCVKASAILSLSSIMTTPLLAKLFMQQRSDHFVSMYVSYTTECEIVFQYIILLQKPIDN